MITTGYPSNIARFLSTNDNPLIDGPLHLTGFHISQQGFTRATYVGIIDNDGHSHCLVKEAAGPIQALLHMLDDLGYHLEILTFRQRTVTHQGAERFLSAIEIDNFRFTHWSLGVGTTSEEASLTALINAANALHSARTISAEEIAGDGALLSELRQAS